MMCLSFTLNKVVGQVSLYKKYLLLSRVLNLETSVVLRVKFLDGKK